MEAGAAMIVMPYYLFLLLQNSISFPSTFQQGIAIDHCLLLLLRSGKFAVGSAGIIIGIAMISLDFQQEQENSLDILIKFQDDPQHPQSHTHEELFLPLTDISVTSAPSAPSTPPHMQELDDEEIIADQLVEKMRQACGRQELRMRQVIGRMDLQKLQTTNGKGRGRKGWEAVTEQGSFLPKRKIIRKKQTG